MHKKLLILVAALGVVALGLGVWLVAPLGGGGGTGEETTEQPAPPKLFGENDYVVETRTENGADVQYIKIPKIGFTAKVPVGWASKVECQGIDISKECWLTLLSQDAEAGTGYLKSGCSLSINAGIEAENNKNILQNIALLKIDPEASGTIRDNYLYGVTKIGTYEAIAWASSPKPIIGEFRGIDIPIDANLNLNFDITIPPNYEEVCNSTWEEFVSSISLN